MPSFTEIQSNEVGNYRAATGAKFVLGRISVAGNGACGQIFGRLYNPAGQLVATASASVHHYDETDANVLDNSFTLPIPSGWNYSVDQNIPNSPCNVEFTVIEM